MSAHEPTEVVVAATIAKMPARTGSGSEGHAAMSCLSSASVALQLLANKLGVESGSSQVLAVSVLPKGGVHVANVKVGRSNRLTRFAFNGP